MAAKPRSRPSLIPAPGERAVIIGQTGSGKTGFGIWVLQRIPTAPVIIYDTKIEPKFDKLVPNIVVHTPEDVIENLDNQEIDYIIVRPSDEIIGEPRVLDEFLWSHYKNCHGTTAFIDEAVTFQINNRAGRGLINLMQRGRSKGITTIMCTQRPVRIDRSMITEASKAYIFYLADKADRKRIDDIIPNFSDLPRPSKYGFYFFVSGEDDPELMEPIELDDNLNTGYVDAGAVEMGDTANQSENKSPEHSTAKHIWV